MKEYCCNDMKAHVRGLSDRSPQVYCHDGTVVSYSPKFNEYGIPCGDGHSHITINYCPWCGNPLLPLGLRDKWFEALFDMGYEDPLFDESIPENYKSDAWWRKQM